MRYKEGPLDHGHLEEPRREGGGGGSGEFRSSVRIRIWTDRQPSDAVLRDTAHRTKMTLATTHCTLPGVRVGDNTPTVARKPTGYRAYPQLTRGRHRKTHRSGYQIRFDRETKLGGVCRIRWKEIPCLADSRSSRRRCAFSLPSCLHYYPDPKRFLNSTWKNCWTMA